MEIENGRDYEVKDRTESFTTNPVENTFMDVKESMLL